MNKALIEEFAEDTEGLKLLQQEGLILKITELICKIMKQQNISRSELANKLKLSKGRVSQILNGETNLTLRTVSDFFTILGKQLKVSEEKLCKQDSHFHFLTESTDIYSIGIRPRWDIEDTLLDSVEPLIKMGI